MIVLALFLAAASVVYFYYRWNYPILITKRSAASPFEIALSMYLAILVGLYIYMLTIALEPFRCFQQADGTLTLVASPNLDCFDATWSQNMFSIVVGLLYIIGIPSFLILAFWKYRNSVETNEFHWRFGLLTSPYNRKYFWWSIYLLTKKTLLVMLIDLTNDYTIYIRTFIVLLLLLSALFIESICKPYAYYLGFSRLINIG
jgi:hypothetical protein